MQQNKKKLFIALEGIDGSGKSTQIKLLQQKLESLGCRVHATAEPTKGRIGKLIREIFNHQEEADQRVIAALFVADRLNHVLNKEDGMLHLLDQGIVVLTDRYYLSSYAYHSVYMEMPWVIEANALAASLLRPTINIYIDMKPEQSMERILQSRESVEMYETLDHLQKVRDKYEEAIALVKDQERIVRVNGNQSVEGLAQDIWKAIEPFL